MLSIWAVLPCGVTLRFRVSQQKDKPSALRHLKPGGCPRAGLPRTERPVQMGAGRDQRKMGKRLGKVPACLAGWADLFGIETDVVAVREQFLQQQARLVQPTCQSQILDEPETACSKGPFLAGKAIVGRLLRIIAAH